MSYATLNPAAASPAGVCQALSNALVAEMDLIGARGNFSNWGTSSGVTYATEVFAPRDVAQVTSPVFIRLDYGTHPSSYTYPQVYVTLGSMTGGVFTPVLSPMSVNFGNPIGGSLPYGFYVGNGSGFGFLLRRDENYFAFCLGGRVRTRQGAPRDGYALRVGNTVQVYFPQGGYALSGGLAAMSYPPTSKLEGQTEPLLVTPVVQVGGGVLAPDLTPWEFLLSGTQDWAAQQRRRLVLGGQSLEFIAPFLAGGTDYGSSPTAALRAVFPLTVPS
ncbi:hypothetical protein [Deinococcus kurensis]|uniref:hypothetical protein n=1 Tax=Deinococcus kurensis TaxID=2662757 RepID=UPI0012D3493B|nr:hypothetical protein [Deinococcus kurensis]